MKGRVHKPAQNLRFGLGFPIGWFCRIIHAFILIFRDGDALISIFRYIRSNHESWPTFQLPGEFS